MGKNSLLTIASSGRGPLVIAGWTLHEGRHRLEQDDKSVKLEPKTTELLGYLARHAGEPLSREELLRKVWPEVIVSDEALTNAVNKIRRAFGDDRRNPEVIETIPKMGYRLIAPVDHPVMEESERDGTVMDAPTQATSREPVGQRKSVEATKAAPRRWQPIATAATIVLIAVAGGLMWLKPWEPRKKPASVEQIVFPLLDKPSIAVLPFVNMSGDKEQEYFSDGISEDIIIDMSRVSNLQVIARNSSFYYKEQSVKIEVVGRELGVQYVLAGSVRKSGDRVRVTAQLVDTTNARQLWADKFDRKLEDIFALQDEITGKIVSALVIQLSAREKAELALKSTRNIAAYDLFLRGRRFDRLGTKEGLEMAQALYREAIQLEPHFGRAYGALARTLTRAMIWGFTKRSAQGLDQALELAQQAVSLNSISPQTHWVLGYVHLHRYEGEPALAATQHSIDLAPNYADGYALLALINNHAGRGQEAIRLINRAMALNPHYTWEYANILGRGYYNLADYHKAVEMFLDALARNELVGIPRLFLISSYVRLGRLDDARWEVAQLQTHNPQMTLSQIRRQAFIWDKEDFDRLLSDLEKVGVAR